METAKKNLARGSPSYLDAHCCSRRKICAIKHREKKHLRRPPNLQRVSGRSPRLNVTKGPEGPLVTADVLPGVILPGSVGSIGICAPLGPAVPALTVGPVGTKYRKNMQTISVPSVPNPAGTVPETLSESLEAQDGARAPSKKLGRQERQYSVANLYGK